MLVNFLFFQFSKFVFPDRLTSIFVSVLLHCSCGILLVIAIFNCSYLEMSALSTACATTTILKNVFMMNSVYSPVNMTSSVLSRLFTSRAE